MTKPSDGLPRLPWVTACCCLIVSSATCGNSDLLKYKVACLEEKVKKADSLREELSKLQIENEVSCLITTHGGGGGTHDTVNLCILATSGQGEVGHVREVAGIDGLIPMYR